MEENWTAHLLARKQLLYSTKLMKDLTKNKIIYIELWTLLVQWKYSPSKGGSNDYDMLYVFTDKQSKQIYRTSREIDGS